MNGLTSLMQSPENADTYQRWLEYNFGHGHQGDIVIDADTTLSQPIFARNLTINAILTPKRNKIFVLDTCIIGAAGQVVNDGAAGSAGDSSGVNGAGGNEGAWSWNDINLLALGVNGGDGGAASNNGTTLKNGGVGTTPTANDIYYSFHGDLAVGGGGGGGGAHGAANSTNGSPGDGSVSGTAGGAGGDATGVGSVKLGGGGGGQGGDIVYIAARKLSTEPGAILSAKGGAGGAGVTSGANKSGNGGGGGGGFVYMIYEELLQSGYTVQVTAGAAGSGGNGGNAGTDGWGFFKQLTFGRHTQFP